MSHRGTITSAFNFGDSINSDGSFTFTPTMSFFGSDTIPFTVIDGYGGETTRTVSVEVRDFETERVAGRMWEDKNSNGIQDPDEPGMPGLTVQLLKNGSTEGTTVTGDDGEYEFDVARDPSADYRVQFAKLDGYNFTSAIAGDVFS